MTGPTNWSIYYKNFDKATTEQVGFNNLLTRESPDWSEPSHQEISPLVQIQSQDSKHQD
jgi:hypothetical protein